MVGPEKAVKLFTYTAITKKHKDDFHYHLLGGLAAGTAQVTITSPYEMIKTNLQMANKFDYSQLLNFKKLYTGASACYLRDIPFSGIYFPVYWWLKEKKELNPFVAGTLAGMPAAWLCTPADVIKTRMQTFKKLEVQPKMFDTAKTIYQNEGITAFFKGGGWRVMRSSPQFGITLLTFDFLQNNLL
jgi:solute carrier family 25 aspartate/glutamate transporter 12/13